MKKANVNRLKSQVEEDTKMVGNRSNEINTLSGELPAVNDENLVEAKKSLKLVTDKVKGAKKKVLELMQFKVYRGEYEGFKDATILVDITFTKCSLHNKLTIPFREIKHNTEIFANELEDFVIIKDFTVEDIIECIEDVYFKSDIDFKADACGREAKAMEYYKDILRLIENSPEEFIELKNCNFDFKRHKGYYLNNDSIVLTKDFLNEEIFVKESCGCEIAKISPNEKGEILDSLKKLKLLQCEYSTRKDSNVHFTLDKSDKKQYAYIFKIDKKYLRKEVA